MKIKKFVKNLSVGLLAVAMMATTLTGCGEKKDTFTVGFDAEYPPYGYMDENGEYTGFDLELAEEVCKLNGWELVKQPIAWDNKDNELNSGSIDCIWNGFTINGREDLYEWSVPYVDNSQVIVVAADSGITDFAGLSGKKVGVQAASAALDVLSDPEAQKALADTFAELNEFSDYNTAFLELEAGAVDAIAMDIGVAKYQIESRDDGKFIILDEHLNAEQYGIGFKLGNTELKNDVEKALKTLKENGKFDELAKKYGLEDMTCLSFE
ncbi:MAG: amino acid ABC transporter substrate-binding protein [Lachnospiraceae bacterium]|nr:amino acid ABC transporter substrate-binding protein [Lachnospiraceae bacterium]